MSASERLRRLAAMPGSRGRPLLALGGTLVIALAGCGGGGDGSIPQDTGDEMASLVDEIRTATDDADCDTAQTLTTDLRNEADTLEGGETKTTLIEMVENLDRNLDEECTDRGTSDEEVDPKPEEDPEPVEPTTTTAVPTTTTPTTTVPEEEEPEVPEQPPGEGGGNSQGPPATPPGQEGGGVSQGGGVEAEQRGKKPKKPKKEKG